MLRRLVLGGIVLALAIGIGIGAFHPDIDAPQAGRIADRLSVAYVRAGGEPASNFSRREIRQWADGWEFRWRFKPCPEFASLRVWISRDGRRASYAELPECGPSAPPLKV